MNAKDIAALLNGSEYGRESVPKNIAELAKANGLVIVVGASDDLVEFYGAFRDEEGAPSIYHMTPQGVFQGECDDDECPHEKRLREKCATIESKWGQDGYSFVYETAIPHATFDIMDEGSKYCRGIVFALADVPEKA